MVDCWFSFPHCQTCTLHVSRVTWDQRWYPDQRTNPKHQYLRTRESDSMSYMVLWLGSDLEIWQGEELKLQVLLIPLRRSQLRWFVGLVRLRLGCLLDISLWRSFGHARNEGDCSGPRTSWRDHISHPKLWHPRGRAAKCFWGSWYLEHHVSPAAAAIPDNHRKMEGWIQEILSLTSIKSAAYKPYAVLVQYSDPGELVTRKKKTLIQRILTRETLKQLDMLKKSSDTWNIHNDFISGPMRFGL